MPATAFSPLIVIALAVATPAFAEPGDMVSVKINISVQDLETSSFIPPQTVDVEICMGKRHDVRIFAAPASQRSSCEIRDYQASESTVTFHESCSQGPAQKESDARFDMRLDGFTGTIHSELEISGQKSMIVDTTYEGTVTGDCDYSPPTAPN